MPLVRRASLHLHPVLTMTRFLVTLNVLAAFAAAFALPPLAASRFGWPGLVLGILIGLPLASACGHNIDHLTTKDTPHHDRPDT